METVLLDTIPLILHANQLHALLKIEPGGKFAERLDGLIKTAGDVAKPKALYKLSATEPLDHHSVMIDGLTVESRVVKINLSNCGRVFPFIATCGIEIDEWSNTLDNPAHRFWADAITMLALGAAVNAMKHDIRKRFKTGSTSTMNPGSLADWPISGQQTVFSLLGGTQKKIGVQLTDNLMMKPLKSVSGLEFESDEKFYNCRLCPMTDCPMRRAPYDNRLFASKYQVKGS